MISLTQTFGKSFGNQQKITTIDLIIGVLCQYRVGPKRQ